MSEEDLRIVRELFDRVKENFERDGYLAPVLFAWAHDRPPTIRLIEGNLGNILPDMCDTLWLSGYDRFALMIEGWIVMGEENLEGIETSVGRMGEHPKAQTPLQIIFVGPEETLGKSAVCDQIEAGWVLVKEVKARPDWSLGRSPDEGDEMKEPQRRGQGILAVL